ncbi:MAG TPA: hypothetical protein VHT50_34195 [Mycobacterium sp.]|jgi:hypothetical protein|nr:hypothetical protein [Mycobacterium sp.]
MAEAALFLGWGTPARGREEAGIDVFNEAMVYWDGLKQEGKLEAIEVALLTPHRGLGGFALLRGTAQQIDSMRRSEEFKRLVSRVALRVDQLEVSDAWVDEGLAQVMFQYQAEAAQVTQV